MISSIDCSDEKPAAWRWPPPPALRGDRRDVDLVVARAQRDPARRAFVARRLADQRDHLRALDRAQLVDDALRVRLLRADVGEVVLRRYETTRRPPSKSCARSSARASSLSFANCTVS